MGADEHCICGGLAEEAHIPMGGDDVDQQFFATVQRIKDHGGAQWWLYLANCKHCGQNWLVAQEERIFDEYFLIKLRADVASLIEAQDQWPLQFRTYEDVLARGAKVTNHCVFFDDLSPSLVFTVEDLRKERPDITDEEIAELLGLDIRHAKRVIAAAGM